jgi:excisionase family DNA binding protein
MSASEQTLFAIEQVAVRWAVSRHTIRRLIDRGALGSVTIGARRLIPLSEIARVEKSGVGESRRQRREREAVSIPKEPLHRRKGRRG